jgi:ribosomal protein L13
MRSAIDAEAARLGCTPSRVAEALLSRHLPEFVRDSIVVTALRDQHTEDGP